VQTARSIPRIACSVRKLGPKLRCKYSGTDASASSGSVRPSAEAAPALSYLCSCSSVCVHSLSPILTRYFAPGHDQDVFPERETDEAQELAEPGEIEWTQTEEQELKYESAGAASADGLCASSLPRAGNTSWSWPGAK